MTHKAWVILSRLSSAPNPPHPTSWRFRRARPATKVGSSVPTVAKLHGDAMEVGESHVVLLPLLEAVT